VQLVSHSDRFIEIAGMNSRIIVLIRLLN